MELGALESFYDSILRWPHSEAELDRLVGLLGGVFYAPLVSFIPSDQNSKVAIKIDSRYEEQLHNEEGLKSYFLKEFKKLSPQSVKNRVALSAREIPRDTLIFSALGEAARLLIAFLPDGSALQIISEKGPTASEEMVLISVAYHLTQLRWVDDLENEIQLRNQFLSIASHELKTPLTSIYGVLQLQERILRLKKDEPPQQQLERQHSLLKMVIRQVERLNELIDGLLDVSRIQNGRFTIEPSDHDLSEILRELVSTRMSMIAKEAGVQFQLDAPGHLSAWVDRVRIEELFSNIIMNAVRFSPEGGSIWIKLWEHEGGVTFSVRDQGPSVPLEDRERIFMPFERAQRTSRFGGLGLGLFISREIAQLHGGTVLLAQSVPGKGNVFEARFPVRNVTRATA